MGRGYDNNNSTCLYGADCVPSTVLKILNTVTHLILTITVNTILLFPFYRKLRLRKIKYLVQGHIGKYLFIYDLSKISHR